MILLTGATGTVGTHLLGKLAADGVAVRALAHSDRSREMIEGYGVEAVSGDFDDPESLARALEGCEQLFLLSPPDQRMAEREMRAIDVAKDAGVRRVVALSARGSHEGSPVLFLDAHAKVDQHLAASGLDYTILRPAAFMQVHAFPVPTVASEGKWYGMTGDGAVPFIDARDIAEVAASVLTGDGHDGQTYELTGPEALSMPEAAAQLGEVLGREVTYIDVPAEAFRATLVSMGLPGWMADSLVALYKSVREGHEATVTNVVENLTGRPPRTYRQFAEDHKGAFAA